MELPLELLASAVFGYAITVFPDLVDRIGFWPTVVLLANILRVLHGSAQVRTNERLRSAYKSQVELHLPIFVRTVCDLAAALLALLFVFVSLEKIASAPSDTSGVIWCSIDALEWTPPPHPNLTQAVCLGFWIFLPFVGYAIWDLVIFVATFPPTNPPLVLRGHNYRRFATFWFCSDCLVFVAVVAFTQFLSVSQVLALYVAIGSTVLVLDYWINRGFYFSDHFALNHAD